MRQDLDLITTWGELGVRCQARKMVRVLRGLHVDIRGSVLWRGKTQRGVFQL